MRDLLRRRQPKRDRGASHRSELPAEGSLLHQVIEAALRGLGGSVECVQAGDQVLRLSTVGLSTPAAAPKPRLRQRISRRVLAARRRARLALEAWVMSVRSGAWGDGFVTRMAWVLVGSLWGLALAGAL